MAVKFVSERNIKFLLYEVFDVESLTDYDYYSEHNPKIFDMVLKAAVKLGKDLLFPIFEEMDRNQPELVDGEIKVHPSVKTIMKEFGEGGWISSRVPFDQDGEQLPSMVADVCEFIFSAANYSANAYPGLTFGASHLIESFGSKELYDTYVPRMRTGEWQGTMALTEPEAGSSLSDITTRAEPTDEEKIMSKKLVSIVKYEKPLESVRRAVELSHGLEHLPSGAKVYIKPNIVFWTKATNFPKYGVITTSRVIEDMVVLLKERGMDNISIGEGTVLRDPKDMDAQIHAFKTLGYGELEKRYGVKYINIWQRPFKKVDLGDGVELKFNTDILNSDFVVDLPVMKTHSMTVVSLGIKNLKGMIDIPSRKKCHNTHPQKDLHFWVSRLADKMPPMFTLIDGIYTAERGPNIDGTMHRSNLLVASADVLSADMVGAKVLGYESAEVPHLVHAAKNNNRSLDLSEVAIVGESIESVSKPHQYDFEYNKTGTLPEPMDQMGIQGLSYYKYDLSLCTYCSGMTSTIMAAIARAWKGEPWDDVEILSGKVMTPQGGKKKTILFGKCIYQAHKDNPDIKEMIAIKGCPPKPETVYQALQKSGIEVDRAIFDNLDMLPGKFLKRYQDRPEFDESFFSIS